MILAFSLIFKTSVLMADASMTVHSWGIGGGIGWGVPLGPEGARKGFLNSVTAEGHGLYAWRNQWAFLLGYRYFDFQQADTLAQMGVLGVQHWFLEGDWSPFLGLALGWAHVEQSPGREAHFDNGVLQEFIGVEQWWDRVVSTQIGVRMTQILSRVPHDDNELYVVEPWVGFTIYLGK